MTKKQKLLLFSMCYMVLFNAMNVTMMNVAIPEFRKVFALTPSEVSWITAIFSLFNGIAAVVIGKMSDRYPIRHLFVIGLAIFMTGSLIGFMSPNYSFIIAARILQGIGGGTLPTLSLVAVARYYPEEKRGYALGMVFAMVSLGSAIGPMLGGFLTDSFGWGSLFLISFLSLITLPFYLKYAPKEEVKTGRRFDYVGAILFMLAITSLLMGINVTAWLLILALVFFVLFAWQAQRVNEPFIKIDILKNVPFSLVLFMGLLNSIAYMAGIFILPLMLAEVNGMSTSLIGLVLFPGGVMTIILGSQIGLLIAKRGNRFMNQLSFICMTIVFLALSTIVGGSPIWISVLLIVVCLGFTANQSALTNRISEILQPNEAGTGTGLFTFMIFLGAAIGSALFSRFLELNSGQWNMLNGSAHPSYSNAFILAAITVILAMVMLALEKSVTKRQKMRVDDESLKNRHNA
ncbi:MFS transporter [Oceanobacillus neutriphilus]|uniref:MFS transporter n=1 Tax=Oceanobacillus neutriphilus TaxID=531815 RepID=A0ABQ2NPS8_9BACI|nr:MFS transporter [Oceanobacillus neutriphilus]GGP08701.1 MFS transporter [Oceanobacillus neutriphilus]